MTVMKKILSALVVTGVAFAAHATTFAKPKVLSSAIEAKWIQAVKSHRTADGSTVSEVLAYVAKARPKQFKYGRFDVGYNGATGVAQGVGITYWIGSHRSPDDAYVDLGYDMNPQGTVLPVLKDDKRVTPATAALESGNSGFLSAVDKWYEETCRPDPDSAPSC